jgi:phage-related protein
MKRLFWIGSSREDLKQFPNEVQDEMGHGLYTPSSSKLDF